MGLSVLCATTRVSVCDSVSMGKYHFRTDGLFNVISVLCYSGLSFPSHMQLKNMYIHYADKLYTLRHISKCYIEPMPHNCL